MRLSLLLALCAAGCAGCPAPPAPAPLADAATLPAVCEAGDLADCACARLHDLECSDWRPNCSAVLRHAMAEGLVDLAPGCLAAATTLDEARACTSSAGDVVVECK